MTPPRMDHTRMVPDRLSLVYGTMEEDEYFVDSDIIDADIREQQREDQRSILMNLICVTTTLAIMVIIVATTSTDPIV